LQRIRLTHADLVKKHPSEYVTESRKHIEYSLGKNDFLIFNLPKSVTKEQVQALVSLKGVQVQNLSLVKALNEDSNAYAYVKVGTPA